MPKTQKGHDHTRELAVAATIVVFVIAASIAVSTSTLRASGLQSCRQVILQHARDSCIYSYANSTMNYSACGLLPGQQAQECISTIAVRSGDPRACGSIQNTGQQYNCIANVSIAAGNQSYCGILSGNNESLCEFAVAKSEGFPGSGCSSISNHSLELECSYISDYRSAASMSNISYCAKLPNDTNSTLVSEIISGDYSNRSGLDAIESIDFSGVNISSRDYCYLSLSVKLDNATSCVNAGAFSSECAAYINAGSAGNVTPENITTLCSSVPSYATGLCEFSGYTNQALSQDNLTPCMRLSNLTYRNSCVSQLAETRNESGYCRYIQGNASLESICNASS